MIFWLAIKTWLESRRKPERVVVVTKVADPLDPRGDGTLRPGDAVYDAMMEGLASGKSGGAVRGYRLDDGTWIMEYDK